MLHWKRAGVVAAVAILAGAAAQAEPAKKSPFAETWIDATHGPEPEMQVQQVDASTFVIRQSIKTNFEGPFLYLFFGNDKALMLDTGQGASRSSRQSTG